MEWLGVAGFALAVVSLVISLTLTWLKWPRIAVEVNQKGGVSFTPQTDTFFLTVINNGSEAITIRTTGFKTGKGSGTEGVDFLDAFLSPAGEALPNTLDGKPAVFPVRIEGHDCRIYEWDDNALATVASGRYYHGYADRYKSFRWWRRSLTRRAWSEKQVRRRGPRP